MLQHQALTERIIGLAIEVHRKTGPGLLESVYAACLCFELEHAGIPLSRQVSIPVTYIRHAASSGIPRRYPGGRYRDPGDQSGTRFLQSLSSASPSGRAGNPEDCAVP